MEPNYVQFFTASILDWKPLLNDNSYKEIIVKSLEYLVTNGRAKVFGFVIMPNHIHLPWQISENHKLSNVQRDFLKFTSQQIQKDLRNNLPEIHEKFRVDLKDRKYQLWQRNPLSVDLYSRKVIEQKLDYIHHNPVQGKWMLVDDYADYQYSSASFYELDDTRFSFLTHYMSYFE